jgi:hypothetical protein
MTAAAQIDQAVSAGSPALPWTKGVPDSFMIPILSSFKIDPGGSHFRMVARRIPTVWMLCACIAATAHEQPTPTPADNSPLRTVHQIDLAQPAIEVTGGACETTVRVLDSESREPVHALIRASTVEGRVIRLNGLPSRARALSAGSIGASSFAHMDSWSILPGSATIELPRSKVRIEFFQGLETTCQSVTLDLSNKVRHSADLLLQSVHAGFSPHWHAGNTHLHLQKMTLAEAEDYACQTAAADGYDIVFFSYLERAEADRHYISNEFTKADLQRFSARSGVVFGYGEEYRHNLMDHPEGYGHVMFLDLTRLVLPASLGRSITKAGNDDIPLRTGIILAKTEEATVLWCHGARGFEDIPSWLAGLLDVQMIFDQGSLGTYEDALYRYWNLGLQAPVATGTDWFFRDMATVYAYSEVPVSTGAWLHALREGRSFISNGPLLELTVNGQPIGSTIALEAGETVTYEATAHSACDFGALEIVVNGTIEGAESKQDGDTYTASMQREIQPTESVWIAARVAPFDAHYDKPAEADGYFNAYGKPVFAHTSPVYVAVEGEPVFNAAAARSLIAEIERNRTVLQEKGEFSSAETEKNVLTIYEDAIASLTNRLERK